MAKALVGTKSSFGYYNFFPQSTPELNKAVLQGLLDDPNILAVYPAPGIYNFRDNIFLHGRKDIFGVPGVIWQPDYDVPASNDSGGHPWFIVGSKGMGQPIEEWVGTMEGISFEPTANTIVERLMWIHAFRGATFRNISMDWRNATEAAQDTYRGFNQMGNNNYWHSGLWGERKNVTFDDIRIWVPQNKAGGEGINVNGFSPVCEGFEVKNCFFYGLGDDPIPIHWAKNGSVHNNRCYVVDGRILIDGASNVSVTGNFITHVKGRDGNWYHGHYIEAHPTSVYPSPQYGLLEPQSGVSIVGNNMETPRGFDPIDDDQGGYDPDEFCAMRVCLRDSVVANNTVIHHADRKLKLIEVTDRFLNITSPLEIDQLLEQYGVTEFTAQDIRQPRGLILTNNTGISTTGKTIRISIDEPSKNDPPNAWESDPGQILITGNFCDEITPDKGGVKSIGNYSEV